MSTRTERLRLTSAEFADAAVLGALAAAIVAVGKVLPHFGAVEALAFVPFGVLGRRARLHAAVCAAVAGATIAVLIAGLGAGITVVGCAVVGGFVGQVVHRERGLPTVLLGAIAGGVLLGAVGDLALLVLSSARRIAFASALGLADGAATVLRPIPALGPVVRSGAGLLRAVLDAWWVWFPIGAITGAIAGATVVWLLLGALLRRMPVSGRAPLGSAVQPAGPVGSLPVVLQGAGLDARPTPSSPALDLTLRRPELVVVSGPNGAGKSTLLQLLAGIPPQSGTVQRPGRAALGEVGGTALVLQRPETQVLGVTVAEDLRWGLPPDHPVDEAALLAEVGLAGAGERPTAGLSGGQLQRLALAAALARRPALLLSDESTAMIDEQGRPAMMALLATLPQRHGTTVVHVSHFPDEAALADRHVVVEGGRVVADGPPRIAPELRRPLPAAIGMGGEEVLRAEQVSVVRAAGTPWAHTALAPVDLTLRAGEGVRIAGPNGSGKSTLAAVLAGLERPASGTCTIDGRPADQRLGRVGLVFQHARLQVQRPVVADDIAAAGGASRDTDMVAFATPWLAAVGLGARFAAARVTELSGGQLRRVALAGVLASRPAVLVLDEPFAGLDPEGRDTLAETLRAVRDTGTALVVITHEPVEGLWDRTLHLPGGAVP